MIVHFVYNLDSYSGAAQQALLLSKNVPIESIIVNVGSKTAIEYIDKTKIIHVKSKLSLRAIFLNKELRQFKIWHFHGFFPFYILAAAAMGKRIVLKTTMLGGDDMHEFSKSLRGRVKLLISKLTDINIVLTAEMQNANSRYFSSVKIELIPNGVDLTTNPTPIFAEKSNTFCYSGLVCERKRTDVAISYFHQHFSHLPNAQLLICGPNENSVFSKEYSNKYIEHCISLVRDLGEEERILFLGNLSKAELFKLLRRSKAVLLFSEKEGLSNAILEAMMFNCVPIVSEAITSFDEILGSNLRKFMINPQNAAISIESIDDAISNNFPRKIVESTFDIKVVSKKYFEMYQNL